MHSLNSPTLHHFCVFPLDIAPTLHRVAIWSLFEGS